MALGPEDIPGFPEQAIAVKTVDLNKRDRDEIDKAYNAMSERLRSKAQGLAASGREKEKESSSSWQEVPSGPDSQRNRRREQCG